MRSYFHVVSDGPLSYTSHHLWTNKHSPVKYEDNISCKVCGPCIINFQIYTCSLQVLMFIFPITTSNKQHEGSPVLDSTDVPSSAPKQSMPEVHGLVGSPALESTCALLSPPTQPILELLFTKPSIKDDRRNFAATTYACTRHAVMQYAAICDACMNKVSRIKYWGALPRSYGFWDIFGPMRCFSEARRQFHMC